MDRKAFIDRIVRMSLFGGIGLLTGFLVSRRKVVHGQSCGLDTVCNNCPALRDCNREDAVKYRQNGRI